MFQSIDAADSRHPQVYLKSLVERIIAAHPRRPATSEGERGAQQILAAELQSAGLRMAWWPVRFNRSLYAVIALHLAIAIAGSACLLVHSLLAASLHLLAGVSYALDSTHRGYWLRRLFPFRDSQNLVGVAAAKSKLRHRVVFMGHADAASTGLLFSKWLLRLTAKHRYPGPLELLRKQMLLAVGSMFCFSALEAIDWFSSGSVFSHTAAKFALGWFTWAWTIAMLLNLEVALRWRVVPGANDNLTGCIALPVLARRMQEDQADDVEFVFVVTGCEEAGAGGANALAQQMRSHWDPCQTTIVNLDTISGGKLRSYREGEFWPLPTAAWLRELLDRIASEDSRFDGLLPYDAPAGMTDYAPFRALGYDGITLCRIDPDLGTPTNYHRLSDTAEHLDADTIATAIDAAERIAREIIRRNTKGQVPS